MTRFVRLMMVGVLAGTLGMLGCGSDDTATGGSGGTGGTGGTGGGGDVICGEGQSIDPSFTTGTGSVECDGLGVVQVPIEVVLAAKPMGDVSPSEATDFDVQIQFIIDEDTVGTLGNFVQVAEIGAASADVANSAGDGTVNVPAQTPCLSDFTGDTDDNGTPGPVVVTTPVEAGAWTAVDGSVVLEATEMTFTIISPVPLTLSTTGDEPACTWLTLPTVSFDVPTP